MSETVELPPQEQRGRLVIGDGVVETIARKAAATVSDTRRATGLSRITSGDLPRVRVATGNGFVVVTVDAAATWPTPVVTVAKRVQDAVTRHVHDQTGLTVTRVDVDVHCIPRDEHTGTRRVQ